VYEALSYLWSFCGGVRGGRRETETETEPDTDTETDTDTDTHNTCDANSKYRQCPRWSLFIVTNFIEFHDIIKGYGAKEEERQRERASERASERARETRERDDKLHIFLRPGPRNIINEVKPATYAAK